MSTNGDKNGLDGNKRKGIKANREVIYSGVPTGEYRDGRDEKPWQRVPSPLILVLLGLYLLLGYLTQLVEDEMPRVINDAEISRDTTTVFSEEAAMRYLNIILGDQPRVAGTPYHLQKTADLKALLDSVAADANPNQRVLVDWQLATGDYWIEFATPSANYYENASNIIALLEGESAFNANGNIGTTLLVNCHYDSVPYAIGASDDGVFCAAMVEVLKRLSRRPQKLKHNVVFLFNGAEENGLHGSHAFLQHAWARGITNVINLEGAGINGKPIIFQASDTRLLSIYRRQVVRPNAQSIGEFLFITGIIPSDTDFRVWRDFGQFHGLDIAFSKGAHVYHTRYDHPDMLLAGVTQNAGDMVLALVTAAADTEALNTQMEPAPAVYYDFLNWFLVAYSTGAAIAVDLLVAVFACVSVGYYVWLVGPRWSTVQELLFAMLGRLVAMLAGVAVCAVLVPIMVSTTQQLRYLSQPWIAVPLFWLPYILTAVCASQAYDAWRTKKCGLNRSIRTLQAMAATRLILAVLLVALTCVTSLSSMRYMFTVPLFIMSMTSLASLTVVRYVRLTAWQHVIMEFVFSLPATMFMCSLALRFSSILLPTMGRTPTNHPDYTIAVVSVGLAIVVSATVSGIELLFSRSRLWMAAAPVAVGCLIAMFVPFSPYQDDGPSTQRHSWFHSEIISYDYNNIQSSVVSGVVVGRQDAYTAPRVRSALSERGLRLNARDDFTDDCRTHVHCNLPVFRLRAGETVQESLFLYMSPPAAFNASISATKSCAGTTCIFNFVMVGPAHNLITLWPREGVNVTSWSLNSPLRQSFYHNGRPVYNIIHSYATYSETFPPTQFSATFIVPLAQQSQPIVDVVLHAHKIYHPEEYTTEFRNLVEAMPRYFNIANFLSRRINYVF